MNIKVSDSYLSFLFWRLAGETVYLFAPNDLGNSSNRNIMVYIQTTLVSLLLAKQDLVSHPKPKIEKKCFAALLTNILCQAYYCYYFIVLSKKMINIIISIYLSIHLSIYLTTNLSIYLANYLPTYLPN